MSRPLSRLCAGAALALGFVLPVDKIVHIVAERRADGTPLRTELEVSRLGESEQIQVRAELHPDRGARLNDSEGHRWLVRAGRVSGGVGTRALDWIPELDVVVLRDEGAIRAWLQAQGVDATSSHLARCGEADCFVIGGREEPNQLWIDKDRFEIRRFRSSSGRLLELDDYQDWSGIRFPARATVSDSLGPVAEIAVRSVDAAPDLESADFSPAWLLAEADER
jgi:hypothetical protein